MDISKLADNFSISTQVTADDIPSIADAGFVAVICNRPDGEEADQPPAEEISRACDDAGIAFHYLPVDGMPLPTGFLQAQRDILERCDGPVLGYCRTGQRARILYEAADS